MGCDDDDDDDDDDDAACSEEVEPYSLLGAVSSGDEELVLGDP